mgnify:CR=1 FL=1
MLIRRENITVDIESMTKEKLLEGIERMLYEINDEEALEEIYNYAVELFEMEKNNGQWKDDGRKEKEYNFYAYENL